MSFQQNVLRVAFVLLIITSVIVFVMLFFSKNQYEFPPMVARCPDYWVVGDDGQGQGGQKCFDKANVSGAYYTVGDTQDGLLGSLTKTELCDLKESLNSSGILWTGISNNDNLCGLEDIE